MLDQQLNYLTKQNASLFIPNKQYNLIQIIKLIKFHQMSNTLRFKQKHKYEWNQDKKFVYVQIPLPAHTSLKKVDIFLSDLIFKVNSLEKNQVHFLDLAHEVDFRSAENKFVLSNGLLHATLKKAQIDNQWQNLLIEDVLLEDLKKRRVESQNRYESTIKNLQENKDKLRIDYDRKATQQLMRFEQEEREKLEQKKRVEKEIAIKEVFSNVNQKSGKIQKPQAPPKFLQLQRQENKWNQKEKLALTLLEKEELLEKQANQKLKKQKNKTKIIEQVKKQFDKQKINNTMFTEEEIDQFEEMRQKCEEGIEFQEVPIRKAANQKVKFSQRLYPPGVAARDRYIKEPPMPKHTVGTSSDGNAQTKNPLWLKDKGDAFVKDKNFISAVQAYSQALKVDSKLTAALMNRSFCYMKMFKLQEAINDCNQCLIQMQSQLSGNQVEQMNSKLSLAKIKTRKAICTAWKGQLWLAKGLLNQVLELQLDEDIKSQVSGAIAEITKREQSNQSKNKGDDLVRVNHHEAALSHYDNAYKIDGNQYAASNKVLCLNKCQEYRKAVQLADNAIKKLAAFNLGMSQQTKEDKQATLILIKLHYRKAKALQELGQLAEAEESVRKGLTINGQDKDLQDYLKQLKKKSCKQVVKKLKDESAAFIKESKISQALENYSKCLKLIEQSEDIQQYLAILQNQCVCYTKLQKYDDVLSTSIRILKIVNNIESRVLKFGEGKQTNNIEKQECKKITVRTLVRRANAYAKLNQYYNAKSDLQKALQISPDQSIKRELQNLKATLSQ